MATSTHFSTRRQIASLPASIRGAIQALARASTATVVETATFAIPPLGQRIAVARDPVFAFAYPALLEGWRAAGAEVLTFSPMADEAPAADADAVYLPGGYPELHAGRLTANANFLTGVRAAAKRGAIVFGECGGYMVLGTGLTDRDGARHAMAGLLPLESSFAEPRLHLGYRQARVIAEGPLGEAGAAYRGHEFHYASVIDEGPGEPLFDCVDARGKALGASGRRRANVYGLLHPSDRPQRRSAADGPVATCQVFGDGAWCKLPPADADQGANLQQAVADQSLAGAFEVCLAQWHLTRLDFGTPGEFQQDLAGDAGKHAFAHRRRGQDAVEHDKDIAAAAAGQASGGVEQQRLLAAGLRCFAAAPGYCPDRRAI